MQGKNLLNFLEKAVVAGINEAGRLWQENEYFLPDVILSAEAFKAVMAEMGQKLAGADVKSRGTVLIGTVEGDMHDLGKASLSLCSAVQGTRFMTWEWMSLLTPLSKKQRNSSLTSWGWEPI